MPDGARLFGSAASTLTNLVLFGVLSTLWPRLAECSYGRCRNVDPGIDVVVASWRPFIDNNDGGYTRPLREPRCPHPRGGDYHRLDSAPLPDRFDPRGYGDRALYACALVAADGRVLDAAILRGTGRAAVDRAIILAVRRRWHFTPEVREAELSWQRVRLNPGPVEGSVWTPQPID